MKEGWVYKKLGEFIKEYSIRDKGKGYPVYSVTNSKGFCQEFFGKNVASEDTSNYKVVPKGYFAYNPSRINVGSVAWQNQEENVSVSPLYVVFSVSPELRQDYLLYYIKSNYSMTFINALSRGAVRNNLRISTLKNFNIPYSTLAEQEKVVSELNMLSGVIEKQKSQLEELDKLAQSIFYDMFGDPVINEKAWDTSLLGNVCENITDGDHMPPPKSEYGIPFITISDIDKTNREIDFEHTFFVPQSYYHSLKEDRKAKIGDVLYTVTGSYGIPVVIHSDINFCFQRHIALLRPYKDLLNSIFLCYWILCENVKHMADDVATGIAQKTVGLNSLRKFRIIIPPIHIQHDFAAKIENIESMKAKVRQSLEDAEKLFNSRMDYYFN